MSRRRSGRRRRRGGCPRRSRSTRSSGCWRRPASTAPRWPLRDRALLELLYGTGARISEAVGLAVDDLDRPGSAVILRGKGGKERIVPVGSYALKAVDDYQVRARPVLAAGGRGTARLFLNARGGPLSRQSAWTILRVAAERAGLASELSPHTLRHSYATHLLDGGADVRVVQELLGHASVSTTQVYTLVTVDRLREVYATAHTAGPLTSGRAGPETVHRPVPRFSTLRPQGRAGLSPSFGEAACSRSGAVLQSPGRRRDG